MSHQVTTFSGRFEPCTGVESLVDEKYGKDYLNKKRTKKELAEINSQPRKLRAQVAYLEKRTAELMAAFEEKEDA